MTDRDLDVVVFGASGVTGRHVGAHLAARARAEELRWAAAGRDAERVERALREEGAEPPETLVADVSSPPSLQAMARRARVVLNLVGPYTRYATPVIEACVANGAHYADLTGEIPLVRRIIDAFDDRAKEAGVKVVQVCGFEALPPDLGAALVAEAAAEAGDRLADVDVELRIVEQPWPPRPSDAISGGTFQSLAAAAGDPDVACMLDPACLVDDPGAAVAVRARSPIRLRPRAGSGGAVIAPMTPSAFINPAVIHRSAALRAAEGGERLAPFAYREGVAVAGSPASLPARYAAAGALSGVQGAIGALARAGGRGLGKRVSSLLARALPESGYGPGGDRLERWRWTMAVRASTPAGRELSVGLDADGHPGYLTTARMLGEAGILMARAGATPDRSGCLTPALALGTGSAGPLEHAGVRFTAVAT